ncbi:MAG: sigma-70 family RNA polymerase sigma factor [Pirellulales bacterium]
MPAPTHPSLDGTSSDLLSRVRARDASAWQRLADLYGPLVYYWCRRAGLQDADTADVVQNAFVAVAASIDGYRQRPGATFRGWLWTVTRSKVNDHFRRRQAEGPAAGGSQAQQRLAELVDYQPNEEVDNDDQAETTALVHRTLRAIRGEFEHSTWTAFWRTVVGGERPVDVAAETGVTPNAVRQAKRRVLRRLREELGEYFS